MHTVSNYVNKQRKQQQIPASRQQRRRGKAMLSLAFNRSKLTVEQEVFDSSPDIQGGPKKRKPLSQTIIKSY